MEALAKLISEAYANILLCKHPLYSIRVSEISMKDQIGKRYLVIKLLRLQQTTSI